MTNHEYYTMFDAMIEDLQEGGADGVTKTISTLMNAEGEQRYVAEKSEGETGWLFPVGDEIGELGYPEMFNDMLDAIDSGGTPMETFYDGYVVNAVMDAAYRSISSKLWEPVIIEDWRGSETSESGAEMTDYDADHFLVKEEILPDGRTKLILKQKAGGKIIQRIE